LAAREPSHGSNGGVADSLDKAKAFRAAFRSDRLEVPEGVKGMIEREVPKIEIAHEYLDAAIEFFLARTNLFCVIHLAAAAEELFGAHLPEPQRNLSWKAEKALKSETGPTPTDAAARKSVNEWKNEVKHMNDTTCRTVTIDPGFAAEHHIEQALVNFYKLKLQKTAAVWKFEDHQNHKIQASG
jgi:hypothetical protein